MNVIRQIGGFFLDFIETIVIALSIFLVVYLFFMQPHQVDGHSMMPNFVDGEYVLTDKISYRLREPQRGEVIVFHAPPASNCPEGTGCDFIKRIVGLPGDTVAVKNNHYYVNGTELEESYIPEEYPTEAGPFINDRTITLGSNEYFVSGDNRPYSSDSRAWGPITKDEIVGRAFFVYWPPQVMGRVKQVQYSVGF